MKHLRYLSYVARHKWFVMLACFRYGLYWQGLIHDWSKLLPSEWIPYADLFYGAKPIDDTRREAFDRAWLKHQHRSPHHWQHWVLREDSGATKLLQMPRRYALEMVADWQGAGRAITGKAGGTRDWYLKNAEKILLDPATRAFVEEKLYDLSGATPPF